MPDLFGPKVGQIVHKCDKSWTFSDQISVHFAEKVPDLSHLGPIWPTLGTNLTSQPCKKCSQIMMAWWMTSGHIASHQMFSQTTWHFHDNRAHDSKPMRYLAHDNQYMMALMVFIVKQKTSFYKMRLPAKYCFLKLDVGRHGRVTLLFFPQFYDLMLFKLRYSMMKVWIFKLLSFLFW